jgi:hypothetical protein
MEKDPQKDTKKSPLKIGLIVLFLLVALYLVWSYIAGDLLIKPTDQDKEPKITWLQKKKSDIPASEQKLDTGEKDPAALISLTPGQEEPTPPPPPEDQCKQTADKIRLFFEHLDTRDYIKGYRLKGISLEHFSRLISKLIANPPIIVRETDDLFAILNNMAHLYRVLGAQDVLLVKDILSHERELIEPILMLFERWSIIGPQCTDTDMPISLPLPGLYQYAGFFLNTLGGQSYLLRRQTNIRVLLRYYSVLILDRANSEGINIYGIDIRYHLNSIIDELDIAKDLSGRQDYLSNLFRIQEKYQVEYGN